MRRQTQAVPRRGHTRFDKRDYVYNATIEVATIRIWPAGGPKPHSGVLHASGGLTVTVNRSFAFRP
jgi:hypothetical protein